MNEAERRGAIVRALERLNPALAGLFRTAVSIIAEQPGPGDAFVIAVAGRTLLIGALTELGVLQPDNIEVEEEVGSQRKEDFKKRLGSAFQLPSDHALVDKCFRAQDDFNRWCHYSRVPNLGGVIAAFNTLEEVLFGLVGPYFDTVEELNRILALEKPTEAEADQLLGILARPAQRLHFFSRVASSEWLPLLERRGYLAIPPDKPDADGYFSPWIEGNYLLRAASAYPQEVLRILEKIPTDNPNPNAWWLVAEIASSLPLPEAEKAATLLVKALKSGVVQAFGGEVISLARKLAVGRSNKAFGLVEALLFLRPSKRAQQSVAGSGIDEPFFGWDEEPSVVALHDVFVDDLFQSAIPALVDFNAKRAFVLLLRLLKRGVAFGAPHGARRTTSKNWCRRLDKPGTRDGIRARLARAVLSAAVAVCNAGEEATFEVLERLGDSSDDIFARLRWAVLAAEGHRVPAAVGAALMEPELLHSWWGGREASALLRAQFTAAPREAQQVFIYALSQGPPVSAIASMASVELDEYGIDRSPNAIRARWIRQRLRWFRGKVPSSLSSLAEEVGFEDEASSEEGQQLAEEGFSDVQSGWVEQRSPVPIEEWAAKSLVEQCAFLREWKPSLEGMFVETSVNGLAGILREWAARTPARATDLLAELTASQGRSEYVTALCDGLLKVVDQLEPADIARLSRTALLGIENGSHFVEGTQDDGARSWRRAHLQLIAAMANRDQVRSAESSRVLGEAILSHACRKLVWEESVFPPGGPVEFDEVFNSAYNTEGGDLIGAALALAKRMYREWEAGAPEGATWTSSNECAGTKEWLLPLVRRAMSDLGDAGRAAQARMGPDLGFLEFAFPGFSREEVGEALDAGSRAPCEWPLWGAYLCGANFRGGRIFATFEPWYSLSAGVMPPGVVGGEHWNPFAHLAEHLFLAFLQGLREIDGADQSLAELARRADGDVLGHLYWLVYRRLADSDEAPPAAFIERLVEWWRWRVKGFVTPRSRPEREFSMLAWLGAVKFIPIATIAELLPRSIELAGRETQDFSQILARLARDAPSFPDAVMTVLKPLCEAVVSQRWHHLDREELRDALIGCKANGSVGTKELVRELVHFLGERGYPELGDLL